MQQAWPTRSSRNSERRSKFPRDGATNARPAKIVQILLPLLPTAGYNEGMKTTGQQQEVYETRSSGENTLAGGLLQAAAFFSSLPVPVPAAQTFMGSTPVGTNAPLLRQPLCSGTSLDSQNFFFRCARFFWEMLFLLSLPLKKSALGIKPREERA